MRDANTGPRAWENRKVMGTRVLARRFWGEGAGGKNCVHHQLEGGRTRCREKGPSRGGWVPHQNDTKVDTLASDACEGEVGGHRNRLHGVCVKPTTTSDDLRKKGGDYMRNGEHIWDASPSREGGGWGCALRKVWNREFLGGARWSPGRKTKTNAGSTGGGGRWHGSEFRCASKKGDGGLEKLCSKKKAVYIVDICAQKRCEQGTS